jgi:excisionase family DNA binding protein
MEERVDNAVVEWANSVRIDQIPGILALLAARLLIEANARNDIPHQGAGGQDLEKLFTAGELAKHLNVPESWVRTEERMGRIPSVRLGKYVRFRVSEVERALAQSHAKERERRR